MAQPQPNDAREPALYRLHPDNLLNISSMAAAAPKAQRKAWLALEQLFDNAALRHCHQLSIEPDSPAWRLRYRCAGSLMEQLENDPEELSWALETLQAHLWGDQFHTMQARSVVFQVQTNHTNQIVDMQVVQTVKGDQTIFNCEAPTGFPKLLDQLTAHQPDMSSNIRARLGKDEGMILLTGAEPLLLDDLLLAINQELISPDKKILSIAARHRFCLPRTTQVQLSVNDCLSAWQTALQSQHDVLVLNGFIPEMAHELVSNLVNHGTMVIQAIHSVNASSSLNQLNASVLNRNPVFRNVDTMINQYHACAICQDCSTTATLNSAEVEWLENVRTPATENVIDWLTDGNTENFQMGHGCPACGETGFSEPITLYDQLERNHQSHRFPTAENLMPLTRKLMALAKSGQIPVQEVMRALRKAA